MCLHSGIGSLVRTCRRSSSLKILMNNCCMDRMGTQNMGSPVPAVLKEEEVEVEEGGKENRHMNSTVNNPTSSPHRRNQDHTRHSYCLQPHHKRATEWGVE